MTSPSEVPTCSIPNGDVVEPDRVAADPLQPHELVDRAVAVDDEVRADAGPLAELDVGRVGGERVVGRAVGAGGGEVLDDRLRGEQPRAVEAVVAARVGAGLADAVGAERDRRPDDPRLRDRGRAGGVRLRGRARAHDLARPDREDRAGVPARARGAERAAVELDHERARKREGRVLPARRGPVQAREPLRGQPGAAGVVAHDRGIGAAGEVHEAEVLVVVDRDVRADRPHEPHQRAGLGLGGGARAGVVAVERLPAAAPARREVAVEIHAVHVLAGAAREPVGIERADRPDLHALGRRDAPQPADHGEPGGLGAVDRARGEHAHRGVGGAAADGHDPRAAHGAAAGHAAAAASPAGRRSLRRRPARRAPV